MAQANRIQIRKGTIQEWNQFDPTPFLGELCLDISSKRIKCGDGFSSWSQLEYIEESGLDQLRAEYGTEIDFILQLEYNK